MITGTLLIVALMAATAFAWGPGRGMGYDRQNCPRYGGQQVPAQLTEEQTQAFNALRQNFVDETADLRIAQSQKKEEMRLLMQTSDPDRTRIQALSNEMADIHKQLRDKQIDFALSAKKIAPELGYGMGFGPHGKGFGRGDQGGFGNQNCGRFSN